MTHMQCALWDYWLKSCEKYNGHKLVNGQLQTMLIEMQMKNVGNLSMLPKCDGNVLALQVCSKQWQTHTVADTHNGRHTQCRHTNGENVLTCIQAVPLAC